MRRPSRRSLAGGAAGILAGIVAGIGLTAVSAGSPLEASETGPIEAAHLPPVLTLPGEPVTLRFAIVCAPRDDGRPCGGSGEVYLRAGQAGPFRRLELEAGADSKEGRYFVRVPADVAQSPDGFSYYAVLRGGATAETVTVPTGGPDAPHRSFAVANATRLELGPHEFGRVRRPDARVVAARWGGGAGEVGLTGTRALGFTGPSSFDVQPDGTVTLLDRANGRIQRWVRGRPEAVPVEVSGGLADLAVEPDGTLHVLEPPNREMPHPYLRSFRPDGAPKWARLLSERTWGGLASGPDGPIVLQQPSEQWFGAGERRGKPGRSVAHGRQLVVARVGDAELRVADLAGTRVKSAWRITSATPLGEVQLVEPIGSGLVAVVKAYTDDRAEFLVLRLERTRIVKQLAVTSAAWAETAPLARFRLSGSSLYHLGSTPEGAFVDRFDLEVNP
jgi:hypothetical protein